MKLPENETRRPSQSRRKFRCWSAGNTGPPLWRVRALLNPPAMLFGRGGCGYSVGERKEEDEVRGEPGPPCATQTALSRRRRCARQSRALSFLNEPSEAEGICLDILAVDASNQRRSSFCCSRSPISSGNPLTPTNGHATRSPYSRANTTRPTTPASSRSARESAAGARRRGSSAGVCDWIAEAMRYFERAEWLRPSGNDDARLRWNACARFLDRHLVCARRPRTFEIEMLE